MSYCWSSSRWSSWWSFNRCPVVGPPEISPAGDLLIGPVDGPPDDGPVDLPKGVLFLVIQKIVQLMIFQKMSCWWSSMRWSGWWSFKRCPHVGQSVDGPVDDLQIFANVLLISNGSLVDVTLDVHLPVVLCPVGSQPELPLIFSYLIVHQQIRNAPVTSSPPNTASCLLLKMMISTIKYLSFSLQINYSNQCCSPAGNVCDLVDIHDGSSLAFCK